MSTDNVDFLPIWKRDSTPDEWLMEVAAIARKYPERFNKAVFIFVATDPGGRETTRFVTRNLNTRETFGTLEMAKFVIMDDASH